MRQKVLLLMLTLLSFSFAWSQNHQISSHVVKANSTEALAGVSISVKGTKSGTSTNNEGRFTLNVPNDNNAILVFSSVGFKAKEVTIGSNTTFEVSLAEEASTMNDVVVVGYTTVRRRDLTGSVSSAGAKELKDIPVNSAAEALTGRLAGVQVTTTEGRPGAEIQVRVRGGGSITQDNSPLYIVDGIQVENALSMLSPQEIQSIDVLKDAASTAIYGARGANGASPAVDLTFPGTVQQTAVTNVNVGWTYTTADFNLPANSALRTSGRGGLAVGDPRWAN